MKRALSIFVIFLLFAVDAKAKDIIDNSQRSQVGDQERKRLIHSVVKKKLNGIPGLWEQARNALVTDPSPVSTRFSTNPSKDRSAHDLSGLLSYPGSRDRNLLTIEFESISDMNYERYGMGYTTDGEYVYAICGSDNDTRHTHGERYDPDTDSWEIFVDGLIPRRYTNAEYVNGKIFLLNGDTYTSNTYTDTVEIIDVADGAVSYSATNPYPVEYAGSAVWNDKIYIFGGGNADGLSARLYEFDPAELDGEPWTRLADMPEAQSTSGRVVDGILYVIGGYNGESASSRIYAYDISQDTWNTELEDMPVIVSAHSTVTNGEGIAVIGDYADIEFCGLYDPENDDFMVVENNMAGRRHSASVFLDGSIFAFGGTQPEGFNGNPEYVVLASAERGNVIETELTAFEILVNGEESATVVAGDHEVQITIIFDTSGGPPYLGMLSILFDSNFNGEPDEDDFNLIDEMEGVPAVMVADGMEGDQNPDVGILEITFGIGDEGEPNFMTMIQNSTWFFAGLDPDDQSIDDVATLNVVGSGSDFSVSGGTNPATPGLMAVVAPIDAEGELDEDQFLISVIVGDGTYHTDLPEPGNYIVLLGDLFETHSNLFFYPSAHFVEVDGHMDGIDFSVYEYTTMVWGHVHNGSGEPIEDAEVEFRYEEYPDVTIESWGSTDQEGYYELWVLGGYEYDVYAWAEGYMEFEEAVFVDDVEYFEYNIMLDQGDDGPEQIMSNPGFEDTYQGAEDWQLYAADWVWWPTEAGNHHIEASGNNIYGSSELFEAFDGTYSLKMWGQYNGEENHTSYYQGFWADDLGGPGTQVWVDGMIMSHQDDWIGQGTNTVTFFVSYFDYDWNFVERHDSAPFSGEDPSNDWHHRGAGGVIPEGVSYVNIGIEYNQMNNDQHGSVYVDNFTAHIHDGTAELAAPHIELLEDIPDDQGRQMRVLWDSGEPAEWGYFTMFSIWRLVPEAPGELWDFVTTVDWHGTQPYSAVVPTLGDSTDQGIYWSTFMVSAHTEDPNFFLDSEPATGYSVDNLHPGVPEGVMANQTGEGILISWSSPVDEDLDHHRVYRHDLDSPDPAEVFTTVDTFFVDPSVTDGSWEYWVTAVDHSGNESDPSESVSVLLSTDEGLSLPTEFALEQNYPNPFNPSTQVRYALPEEAQVILSVYDMMGRKVRTLVRGTEPAGYQSVLWNATNDLGLPVSAGVYICTIQAGDYRKNMKMILLK